MSDFGKCPLNNHGPPADAARDCSDAMKKLKTTQLKRVYQRPELIEYGDIRALTENVGQSGNPDGGHVTGEMMSQP
jgi:hypothetical protein